MDLERIAWRGDRGQSPGDRGGIAPIAVIEMPISAARKRTSRTRFMDHGLSTALNASDCRNS